MLRDFSKARDRDRVAAGPNNGNGIPLLSKQFIVPNAAVKKGRKSVPSNYDVPGGNGNHAPVNTGDLDLLNGLAQAVEHRAIMDGVMSGR